MNEPLLSHPSRPIWPQWHNQPLRLTVSEIESPHIVIEQFFQSYHLPDIRACLNNWLLDAHGKETIESKQHLFTHNDVEKLVEAAWLIYQNRTGARDLKSQAETATQDRNQYEENEEESTLTEILNKPPRTIEFVKKDPLRAMRQVFGTFTFEYLEESLQSWFYMAIISAGTIYDDEPEHRAGLLTLFEALQVLLEALNLIHIQYEKQKSLTDTNTLDEKKNDTDDHFIAGLLTREQYRNPKSVVTEFFKKFPIVYIRRELLDWLDAGLSYGGPYPGDLPPLHVYYTYDSYSCLTEAAYFFNNMSLADMPKL